MQTEKKSEMDHTGNMVQKKLLKLPALSGSILILYINNLTTLYLKSIDIIPPSNRAYRKFPSLLRYRLPSVQIYHCTQLSTTISIIEFHHVLYQHAIYNFTVKYLQI